MNLDRRDLMGHFALLLGVAALPAEAFAAPKGKAKGKAAPKKFFTPSQTALVTALADTFIPKTDTPGAVEAGVVPRFDAMMGRWASAKTKAEVVAALAAVDKMALETDRKTFAALAPARRKELLIPYDKAALKPVPPPKRLSGLAALMGGASFVVDPGYSRVKDLIIGLHYSSEASMTKDIIYEHIPGPYVASLKLTKDSRPFSGLGTIMG
ncbi:gluconate 2-dehydrogenase subunit 3 family protein [Novosphingobium sp. TH158]|uniref:gluconate 2-dehydrogenase subunit 3 family protein n=1 Tax=Novosphingobium sp. TH158 TaxID=2067455 RepID=UPI0013042DCA|nr:gluconate 2-dehydrogenase subunit 3 family protein [Novosphingobium sp. TH158]